MTWQNRRYGLLGPGTDDARIRVGPAQNLGGFPVGIVFIEDVHYPYLPGNVCNGWTYDFPVRMQAVEGLTVAELFAAGPELAGRIVDAATTLQRQGARVIVGGCGFFGTYQREVADALDVPVGLSSLLQVPWVGALLKSHERIGVLTASAGDLTPALLAACGVADPGRLVVRDLGSGPEFSAIIEGRGEFDNAVVRAEVVAAARDLVQEGDIGAIILECSDMPPYAADVQAATGLPVFDFVTLIRWLASAVSQRPYTGFL